MRTIAQSPTAHTRVWLDELPEATYAVLGVSERSVAMHRPPNGAGRRVAVEVVRMAGHPSSYALLGATFTPEPTARLRLQVASSAAEGTPLTWALAGRCDEVYAGLPEEYAACVLDTATDAAHMHDLGPGILRFDHAAHGVVGSSRWLFGELGRVVVTLLARPGGLWSDDELAEITRLRHRTGT